MRVGADGRKANSRTQVASISFSRLVYSLSWFNLAATFPALSFTFHYSLQELAMLTTVFLVGAGAFQIPAGLCSARKGAKNTSLYGIGIIGVSSLLSGTTGNLLLQLAMRFFTGIGAALYFAPTLVMVSKMIGARRSGLAVGMYQGAFNLGGGITLFAFGSIAASYGWRMPFLLTGCLAIIALIENKYALSGIEFDDAVSAERVGLGRALKSKDVWMLDLAMIGMNGSYYVVTQFSVDYVQQHLGLSPQLAGFIASLALFGALIGAPIGGWIADILRRRKLITGVGILGAGLAALLLAIPRIDVFFAAEFLVGFFSSVAFTNCYTFPTEVPEIGRKYAPIAIGLLNTTGILAGSVIASAFGVLVPQVGYALSWVILTAATLLFAPAMAFAREPLSLSGESGPASIGASA